MAKSTSKKAAPKSKAKPEAKAPVKYEAKDVVLNKPQSKNLDMIAKNQVRIEAGKVAMLKIAADSGLRLLKLKEEIQSKYGRVWKAWASTEGNLSVGYEQASRYMKLASASADEMKQITSTSIEGAVKEIEHIRKPEKPKTPPKPPKPGTQSTGNGGSTLGVISPATLDEIEGCNSIEELEGVIELCHQRIDALKQAQVESDDDIIEGTATEVEDEADLKADIEDALS